MRLVAEQVSLSYGDGDTARYAVREINLAFPERGFFGIMGPSGSGKSSLLYLLSGLKLPTSGAVYYGERNLSRMPEAERVQLRRRSFGFVFQQPFLLNYLTARENILTAAREDDRDAANHVEALMEELDVRHLANRTPAHLSGGERQRIVVARAMMNRPSILFADEPTAALDHANGYAVIDLLKRYRDRGTVLVVTHDPSMVKDCDTVHYLLDGLLDRTETRSLPS